MPLGIDNELIVLRTEQNVSRKVCYLVIFPFHGRYLIYLTNETVLNNFSLLPAPLHVPYRDKDEDDDLEKAYKDVSV